MFLLPGDANQQRALERHFLSGPGVLIFTGTVLPSRAPAVRAGQQLSQHHLGRFCSGVPPVRHLFINSLI